MTTPIKNRDKFLAELNILHRAAIGVVAIRTREPFRAVDALHGWSYSHRLNFAVFSQVAGWMTYSLEDPNAVPQKDNNKDIMAAVAQIDGHGPTSKPDGIYILLWPHFALPKIPPLIQMIAELARSCAEKTKRVLLVVPPTFELPPELQESVAILDFDLPNRSELAESYARVVGSIANETKKPRYEQIEVDNVVSVITGLTEMEAESALARAVTKYKERFPNVPVAEFISELMKVKTEVIKRSDVLEIMPSVGMDTVGGLGSLKAWARERVGAFGQEARDAGVDRPKGILLVGPPGTGKSLAAKAMSGEMNLPLVRFDLSRVYGSLVGQSEQKVREALKTATAMAPCILMVDEIEKAVSGSSGANDGGVSSRVLGAILTHMQEDQSGIFWMMTANRTQALPSEIVRKGRLDEIFAVSLPNEEERAEIFRIHLRKRKEDPAAFDLGHSSPAIIKSAGHVGAEIEAAVSAAKLRAFNQRIPLTAEMIAEQFGHSKPLKEAFKVDFDAMQEWAENNARPASAVAPQPRQRTRSTGSVAGQPRQRALVDDAPGDDISS